MRDVSAGRRDGRLATLDDPQRWQWLTIPTHFPHGRRTLISSARHLGAVRALMNPETAVGITQDGKHAIVVAGHGAPPRPPV
ncbi:hypothetical protein [Streptomyces sp. NRRL S-1824]|uniref:hypothetical protein n=1 Tax=Streptomyces sp. NRRL S-1824 TaxID=1463889 RepID=UPI0004C71AA9|nr:hypothetical protein [Streptomyces sp. NRRL S-1824]